MSRATKATAPAAAAGPITAADCARVRKERDRHVTGGGAWQAWDRVLDVVELQRQVQEEHEAAQQSMDDAGAVPAWLAVGGTV